MVFNVTFNNISVIFWRSVLLVEETGVPGYGNLILRDIDMIAYVTELVTWVKHRDINTCNSYFYFNI